MAPRTSAELRRAWHEFFGARQHTIVPSAGWFPTPPSVPMFTKSDIMPFVPYFIGEEPVPWTPARASSVQRCVRAGGKHNDLDAIGRSHRHLSFFEMLGNFSFGDYFKAEAIAWAWEFVTEVLGLDADRLWVSVHVDDDEAAQLWTDSVGFPAARIQRFDEDNFWEMGDTGPCGPSSEIFWDNGPAIGPDGGPANPAAEDRYVEIWNLVFQQYNRGADGKLSDLPSKNIDTGAGLERIMAALAGSHSLYDSDVLSALVGEAQSVTGHRLGESELGDIALRLLADHARTMTFLVGDGVIPSNEDRGYVLRRIIRRAIRFAYLLGVERPVLPTMVERTIELMGDDYPEIVTGRLLVEHGPTEFTGRREYETEATVIGVIGDAVYLDRTPFYAESGGQIGDTGIITTDSGMAEVVDTTYALPGLHAHHVKLQEGTIEVGQRAVARIDGERRDAIRRNHTGTHILHWALREVLGQHVKQQGSLVAPDRLRFDFSHFEPVTDDQLRAIEDLANREILDNAPVRHFETTMDEARSMGAIAFFGDKYGDIVRVLEAGEHSVELCGGTHVRRLGDIGPLKVVSEGSIGSNLRRIEAVTGFGPIERLRQEEELVSRAADVLGTTPDELPLAAERLRGELRSLRDELKDLRRQAAGSRAGELAATAIDGVVVARIDGIARDDVRDLAVAVREQPGVRAVVVGGEPPGGGVALVAAGTKDSGLKASELIAEAARTVGGGGGKSPALAGAGGRAPSRLDEALDQARAATGVAGR